MPYTFLKSFQNLPPNTPAFKHVQNMFKEIIQCSTAYIVSFSTPKSCPKLKNYYKSNISNIPYQLGNSLPNARKQSINGASASHTSKEKLGAENHWSPWTDCSHLFTSFLEPLHRCEKIQMEYQDDLNILCRTAKFRLLFFFNSPVIVSPQVTKRNFRKARVCGKAVHIICHMKWDNNSIMHPELPRQRQTCYWQFI